MENSQGSRTTRSGALARLYIDGSEIRTDITVKTSALSIVNNGLIIGQDQDAVTVHFGLISPGG